MSVPAAVEIIREASGSQFDPRVVGAFLQRLDSIVELRAAARDGGASDLPATSRLAAA
jgi:HD-GYP domain-containing protein (c-di-GMP phosphodiesterase class II)